VNLTITFREGPSVSDGVMKALLMLDYRTAQETATARDYFFSLFIKYTSHRRECKEMRASSNKTGRSKCSKVSCHVGLFYDEPLLIKCIVSNLEAVVAGVRCVGCACLVRLRRETKIYRRFGNLDVAIFGMNESGGHWGY
jgi:hypothetical protein